MENTNTSVVKNKKLKLDFKNSKYATGRKVNSQSLGKKRNEIFM